MPEYFALRRDADSVDSLAKQVDLIYIDPPFCTQREFKLDSVEKIGFTDKWTTKEDYLIWLNSVTQKLFNKLKPTGSIYIHNNFESNAHLLSQLPPEMKRNYQTTIYWQRSHPHNNIERNWGNIVDTIMVFSKTKNPFFRVQYQPLDETYRTNSFNNVDENGKYALAPITGEKSRPGKKFEHNGVTPTHGWRKNKEEITKLDDAGLLHFGKNKPYKKIYLAESKGRPIQNIWSDIFPITRTEKDKRHYPTQKPVKLLKRIIFSSCPDNGTVFDPFAGSGTTLRAVLEINKENKSNMNCILSDVNEDSLKIINREIKADISNAGSIWPIQHALAKKFSNNSRSLLGVQQRI